MKLSLQCQKGLTKNKNQIYQLFNNYNLFNIKANSLTQQSQAHLSCISTELTFHHLSIFFGSIVALTHQLFLFPLQIVMVMYILCKIKAAIRISCPESFVAQSINKLFL